MPPFVADLHIHSHFSRATSADLTLEQLSRWAQIKGVQVVATGDIAHPGWLAEIKSKLEPAEEGLFRLQPSVATAVQATVPAACQSEVRFLLGGEVSNIYKRRDSRGNDAVRKIHHLLFMPHIAAVERLQAALERIGNIRSDGRPILGLDSHDLLEIVLETDAQAYLIPAHIWTPWFAILGSKSGFDSIADCFAELTPHIFALETGLSADPPMCWRVSELDGYTLISNSDAHSPPKLAREATLFNTEISYPALFAALKAGDERFDGTLEFFPEEGKYYMDGHRACGVRWEPGETVAHGGRCSVCGKPVTIGVMHRVATLADRPLGAKPARPKPYENLISLPEILAQVVGVGATSNKVQQAHELLLSKLGPELTILRSLPLDEIQRAGGELVAEGIRRVRASELHIQPGYDGEYGVIQLFTAQERASSSAQLDLFGPKKPTTKKKQPNNPFPAFNPLNPLPKSVDTPPLQKSVDSNPDQQTAIHCIENPLLIIAGPGTGKTYTLTRRIAYLVAEKGVDPAQFLTITFTNKAADELRTRLEALIGSVPSQQMVVKTFHALGSMLLRRYGAQIGLAPTFAICRDEERRALLKGLYPDLGERALNERLDQLAAAKNQLLTPENMPITTDDEQQLAQIYRTYQAALQAQQLVDFDDLLLQTVLLLEHSPALLGTLHARFRWLAVDEYQDVNLAQYRLLRLLAAGGANLCAIGDPDQAIYGFRGADRGYFLRFTQDFPDAQVLRLRQNYRSTQLILDAAQQVIGKSAEPSGEGARLRLWSTFLEQTKVESHLAATDKAEAEYVVHQIEQMVGGTSLYSLDSKRASGHEHAPRSFADFAVLYRLNGQSPLLIEALQRSGIPFQTVGQTPLVEQKEIRELLAYLWLLHNPQATLYRELILAAAPKKQAVQITTFLNTLRIEQSSQPVTRLIEQIQSFITQSLARLYTAVQSERIQQFTRRATPFGDDLCAFLEAMMLQSEADFYDPRADRVTLMTLHAAKGLEFPVVFLVGCEEKLLPYQPAGRTSDLEEERRLFYVGMTRARQKLILTQASERFLFGQAMHNAPSRFLGDIEQALKEIKAQAQRKVLKEKPAAEQLQLF